MGIDQLQARAQARRRHRPSARPVLHAASYRQTAMNDFGRSERLLTMCFPYLLPYSKGDFNIPRHRPIKYGDYIGHCMRWHDGRFARHPTFSFVITNQLTRQAIRSRSAFYFKRTAGDAFTDCDVGLQQAFAENTVEAQKLKDSIVRLSGSFTGTKAYWMTKRAELQAMVRNLDCPDLFLTFSAADLHWDSLQRHMSRYEEWKPAAGSAKFRIARENLRDNPHIAAHHFYHRFSTFMKLFVNPKFGMEDYWNRFEWQAPLIIAASYG